MKAVILLMALMLAGCAATEQRFVLMACLEKCSPGDANCINACGNILRGGCR